MPLNIFQGEDEKAQKSNKFADDVVGSFRAGHVNEKNVPESLDAWRVTTGDPEVAEAVASLLNGDKPAKWDTKGEEDLETYTEAKSVYVVLEGTPDRMPLRQRFVQRNKSGEVVYTSDGATKDDGEADPHKQLPLKERLQMASDGLGPSLETTIWFRLDDSNGQATIGGEPVPASELGKWRFTSTGKTIGLAVINDEIEEQISEMLADGAPGVRAKLSIENISYVAKKGKRAGETVSFNTAALKILGPVR